MPPNGTTGMHDIQTILTHTYINFSSLNAYLVVVFWLLTTLQFPKKITDNYKNYRENWAFKITIRIEKSGSLATCR